MPFPQAGGFGKVVSQVLIGLRTVKGTKQLKLDPTIYDSLQKEKVQVRAAGGESLLWGKARGGKVQVRAAGGESARRASGVPVWIEGHGQTCSPGGHRAHAWGGVHCAMGQAWCAGAALRSRGEGEARSLLAIARNSRTPPSNPCRPLPDPCLVPSSSPLAGGGRHLHRGQQRRRQARRPLRRVRD